MSLRFFLKKDILYVVLSKVANGTTTLLLNIYAVHFLIPAEFGALTLCTTFLMLLDGLFGAAIDLAVVKFNDPDASSSSRLPVERVAMSLKILGCVGCGVILVMFSSPIGKAFLHQEGVRPLFLAWSVAATSVMMMRSTQLALQVRHCYASYARIELLNTGARILLVIWAVHHGHQSSVAVMSCFALGSSIALVAGFLTLVRQTKVWVWWGLAGAGKLIFGSRTALLTYGVSAFVARLDIILLALFGDPVKLGIYGSAMTLASIPEIAATYLAPAFLPRILSYCRQGVFVSLFKLFHLVFIVVAVLCCLLAIPLIPKFGPLILPPKYLPALPVLAVLLPGTLATASIFPLCLNLLMLKNNKVFLAFDCLTTPVLVAAYWLAAGRGVFVVAAVTTCFRILKAIVVQTTAYKFALSTQQEMIAALPD